MPLGLGTLTRVWIISMSPWLSLFQFCVCCGPSAWGKGPGNTLLRDAQAGHRDMSRQATE